MFGAVMRMKEKKENHGRSPTQLRKHEKKSTGLSFGNVHPRYNLDLPARPDVLTYSGGVARNMGVGRGHRSNKSNAGKRVAIIQRMRNNVVQRCGTGGHSGRKLSEMSDAELGELGYKRHGDGSIRDSQGHFAGNSGTIPGTPGVDLAQNYLMNNCGGKYRYVAREICVRSSDGKKLRRYDIVVQDSDGNYIGVEVKSGNATRTPHQVAIDNDLINSGGLNAVGPKAADSGIDKISYVMLVNVDANGNVKVQIIK